MEARYSEYRAPGQYKGVSGRLPDADVYPAGCGCLFFGQHEGFSRGITALILNISVAAKDVPASTNSVVGRRESVLGCLMPPEVLPISISGFLKLFDINLIQKGTGMRS